MHTSKSLVFPPKSGLTVCDAIVGAGAASATSVESRKGFVEIGRSFIVGLGSAGLGGPFRLRKGLLERSGDGPPSERRSKGSVCDSHSGQEVDGE